MNKLLLYLSCLIAVFADMLFVIYAKSIKSIIGVLIIAILLNALGVAIWTYSMKKGIEAPMAITVYAVLTVIGCSLTGNILFKEQISLLNWIGIVLASFSMYLISK